MTLLFGLPASSALADERATLPTAALANVSDSLRDGAELLTGQGQGGPRTHGLDISTPNGYVNLVSDDLSVQTTAGPVRWSRSWDGQEWKFNPHWESLSQSWKNLTGSQTADTTSGAATGNGPTQTSSTSSSGTGEGCWVWVDEGWQPSTGTVVVGGVSQVQAAPMPPERMAPFNRIIGEGAASDEYIEPQRVNVDYASLCAGSFVGGSAAQDVEALRRMNELYVGEGGRYAFSNRATLDKRAVKALSGGTTATVEAQLASGRYEVSAPATLNKGYRWMDRSGDWIDYNTQGQVVAWGDRNDNTVWLVRDTGGVLRGVVDAGGHVIYTLHYTGALLTEVRDHPVSGNSLDLPARSVKYTYDERNRLVKVTDARGNDTAYAYDVMNRVTRITDPEGRSDQLTYRGDGVASHTAADGGVTDYVFEYDDTNKQFISKITGPETTAGRRVEDLTHNRVGKLVRRIVNGRIEDEYRYDTGARVDYHTNVRGFTTRTTKDEFENVTRIDYPDGASAARRYSALHLEMTEETEEAGTRTQYEHDAKGNLLKKAEAVDTPQARSIEYQRNGRGQATQLRRPGRTESDGSVTLQAAWTIEYDALGQTSKTTDPEGHVRQYVYDRAGHLARYTDPLGHSTRYEFDAHGNLVKTTDALGRVRSFTYDKVGNLTRQLDAKSLATQSAYDALNRRTQTTNPVGGVQTTRYDLQGLPVRATDEDGRVNQSEYDNFLRLVKQIDAFGHATTFGYDIADGSTAGTPGSLAEPTQADYPSFSQQTRFDERERPTRQSLRHSNAAGPQTVTSATGYDKRGLVTLETDPEGHERSHTYDALGQRTQTTDALGGKTGFAYDARGNLLQLTDANGNAHGFRYDRNNRLVEQRLPLGQTTRWRYDAAGNLSEKIDANGHMLSYAYDAANRLIELKHTRADGSLLRTTIQTWDANDNLTAWSDTDASRPSGHQTASATLSYDAANRKTGETVSHPNPAGGSFTLSYGQAHSPAGKKTRLTWPDGTQIDYAYSAHGELQSVAIPGEGTLSIDDYQWTAPLKTTLPGGSTQAKRYDGLLNLESLQAKTPGQQTTLDLSNAYGKLQELKSRSRTDSAAINGTTGSSTQSSRYQYDAETRLTQASTDRGGLFGTDTESFTLDLVGNRTAHSRQGGLWIYDKNNRLTQRGSGSSAVTYEYDEAGNLSKKTEAGRTWHYAYDALNRLSEVKDGQNNPIARYGYDPQDRRLWKERYRDSQNAALSSPSRTYYLYADEGLIAEATQAITVNADGSTTSNAAPQITTQYGPRPDSEFTTGTLFVKTKNSNGQDMVAYYHQDHLQTPIQATDKQGNVVWSANYEPFGKATITTPAPTPTQPTIDSNLRLPGQYEDQETGLHYNFRRYYEPTTGRYVTEDPIGLAGGVNIFLYADGSPLSKTDPTGLKCTLRQRIVLQLAVQATCKWVGATRCESTDDCSTNRNKIAKNSACAWARRQINQRCFSGGDAGHKEAEDNAKKAVERCLGMRAKCCAAGNDG